MDAVNFTKKIKNKYIFLLNILFLILFSNIVSSLDLNCDYDPNPSIETTNNKIPLTCYFNEAVQTTYKCYSYVYYNQTLIQINPEPKSSLIVNDNIIMDSIDYFSVDLFALYFNVYYTSENIYPKANYTLKVVCNGGDGSVYIWNGQIIPQYKDLGFLVERSIWFKNNISNILIGCITIAIFIFLIVLIYRNMVVV